MVPVIQSDRDAEAELLEAYCHFDRAEDAASGERDSLPGVQAFARYRMACQAELLEALEAMVVWANGGGATGGYPGEQVARAIRNAKRGDE